MQKIVENQSTQEFLASPIDQHHSLKAREFLSSII